MMSLYRTLEIFEKKSGKYYYVPFEFHKFHTTINYVVAMMKHLQKEDYLGNVILVL